MNYDDALKAMDDIDRLFKVLDFKDKNQYSEANLYIIETTECDEITAKAVFEELTYGLVMDPQLQFEENVNIPKCPTCGSTNIKKISGLSKVGSVALWGVFAVGKVSKQWHCNNCGSEW